MTTRSYWSDEVRVMLRPTATYRQLASSPTEGGLWLLLKRPLFVALVFGAFVSFTAAGRLTLPLLLDGGIHWSFVLVLQTLIIAVIVLIAAKGRIRIPRAIDLFFIGHGPWLLWLLVIAGSCLFFPTKQIFLWPPYWGWLLPVSLLCIWLWSNITTFAFLRGVLNLSVLRATALMLLYIVILWGTVLAYLFTTETLQLHRFRF